MACTPIIRAFISVSFSISTKNSHNLVISVWFQLKQNEWRKEPLKRVVQNRCSESCSLNRWKIPMKNYIFSKVADWEPRTLLKMNFVRGIFQGFWLRISPCNFPLRIPISKNTFFREHLQRLLLEWKKPFERFLQQIFLFSKYLFVNFSLCHANRKSTDKWSLTCFKNILKIPHSNYL